MTPRRITISLLLFFLLLVLIASGLVSCSSSSRLKASVKTATDSTAVKTESVATVASKDSVSYKTLDTSYSEEITFLFDTETGGLDIKRQPAGDSNIAAELWRNGIAEEYLPGKPANVRKPFKYKIGDRTIETDRPVSSVTIKSKSQVQKKDSIHVQHFDSSKQERSHQVQVKTATQTNQVVKKTTRFFSYWWIIVLVLSAAGIYYCLRRYNLIDRFFS